MSPIPNMTKVFEAPGVSGQYVVVYTVPGRVESIELLKGEEQLKKWLDTNIDNMGIDARNGHGLIDIDDAMAEVRKATDMISWEHAGHGEVVVQKF